MIARPPQRTRTSGRVMMNVSAFTMIVTALMAYPFVVRFALRAPVAAHLLLPVAAGVIKLGYVVRLVAHPALGNTAAG